MRKQAKKAFTLVEILIVVVILGILAAIVVPQFTSASEDAQIGNVQTQLQTIRSQIELYRVRNNGDYPDFANNANGGWGDPDGADAEEMGLLGNDYLRSVPVNPRTGTSTVIAGVQADAEVAASTGDDGWVFDAAEGEIYAMGLDEANGEWVE